MFRIAAMLLLSIPAVTQTCTQTTTFNPAIQGQVNVCDAVPPTTACVVSVAGESSLCRVNGVLNISENGQAYKPLYVAPVDVFRFVAPSNIAVSPKTNYYLGSLVALGHGADMVYLVPNACTLTKMVFDTRSSGALSSSVTMALWDATAGNPVAGATATQAWTGTSVESVVTPNTSIPAGDKVQIRFSMPANVPSGFYLNMTITAYCTES